MRKLIGYASAVMMTLLALPAVARAAEAAEQLASACCCGGCC
jgi:hypothetical protein